MSIMKTKVVKIAGVIIALIAVIFITTSITRCAASAEEREEARRELREANRERWAEYKAKEEKVEISESTWRTARLSDAAIFSLTNLFSRNKYRIEADLSLENGNDFEIKDFKIRLKLYGNSGTHLKTYETDTIYESIPAYGELELKDIDIGYAKIGSGRASIEFILPTEHYHPIAN